MFKNKRKIKPAVEQSSILSAAHVTEMFVEAYKGRLDDSCQRHSAANAYAPFQDSGSRPTGLQLGRQRHVPLLNLSIGLHESSRRFTDSFENTM
jgi:hypothetical protein